MISFKLRKVKLQKGKVKTSVKVMNVIIQIIKKINYVSPYSEYIKNSAFLIQVKVITAYLFIKQIFCIN